jgi:hypothetical protein
MKETLYTGAIEVELTGLAMVRQRRMINIEEPLAHSSVVALARATEGNHVWDYGGMREETIDVTILSQPFVPEGRSAADSTEPTLLACIAPDGCPGVQFDASQWLKAADAQDIRELRETSFGEHYLSDELAQGTREYDAQVDAVLTYCEVTDLGFTCTLSLHALEQWMTLHRPDFIK